MLILELPPELLQLTIDIAVQHTDLQCAIRFREACRLLDQVVQRSIFRLPKAVLLQRRLSLSMRRRFVQSKMLLGNADELLLCYTINRTVDYLTEYTAYMSRDRYVQILEIAAVDTLMYWRLLDCLTTERQRNLGPEELKSNALLAAVGAEETITVQKLLEEGANPGSSTPLFGEPLALAASSGSLAMVQLLLDHWDWENYAQLTGLRLANAIETAAAADHECVLTKLLDHKDRISRSTYDDAIIRMVRCNRTASVERLLALRQADSDPAAKTQFWLRLVRTAAGCDRRTLLQRILAEHLPDIEEASLVIAMNDAGLKNHGEILRMILPHVSISDPACYADCLFWIAWFGNVGVLQHLLTFLQNDQRALLLACAGAVSGKAVGTITHLFKVAGVSHISKDVGTCFTNVASLMLLETKPGVIAEVTEPLSASALLQKLTTAAREGELAGVINFSNALKAHHSVEIQSISRPFYSAGMNARLDVLLFLCEHWKLNMVPSSVKSPAVAQIFTDFGWDVNRMDYNSRYPRPGNFVHDEYFVRWMLCKEIALDSKGALDMTAVSVAITRASMPTIKLLLHRSIGVQEGRLLHFAILREGDDSLEIVELLLNLGCPIDDTWVKDDSRLQRSWEFREHGPALFTAAEKGKDEMVAYLLSRGADAALTSNKGRTALDVAESKQHSRVIQLLRQHTRSCPVAPS